MKPKTFRALKAFAQTVGLTLKQERQTDGFIHYVLYDARKEYLCIEFDTADTVESIGVYAGGHPEYVNALAAFQYEVAE